MKNKFLVLLFALVMILGVVGCSKKANDNANTNEQTAQNIYRRSSGHRGNHDAGTGKNIFGRADSRRQH